MCLGEWLTWVGAGVTMSLAVWSIWRNMGETQRMLERESTQMQRWIDADRAQDLLWQEREHAQYVRWQRLLDDE